MKLIVIALANFMAFNLWANQINFLDYNKKPGVILEYDIINRNGEALGDINKEIFKDSVEGNSFFMPKDVEYFAEFYYDFGFYDSGETHIISYNAETKKDGEIIDDSAYTFSSEVNEVSYLQINESRTTVLGFTKEEQSGEQQTEWTFNGFEEVTVPAGTFEAAKVTKKTIVQYDSGDEEITNETAWLVEKIGAVKRNFNADCDRCPDAHVLTNYFIPHPVESWKIKHFTEAELQDETISGDGATPANDGAPNLLKYALGLDPKTPIDRMALPRHEMHNGYLTMTFSYPKEIKGVRFIPQISSDLVNWHSDYEILEVSNKIVGDFKEVIVMDKFHESQVSQRFMRLKIERK